MARFWIATSVSQSTPVLDEKTQSGNHVDNAIIAVSTYLNLVWCRSYLSFSIHPVYNIYSGSLLPTHEISEDGNFFVDSLPYTKSYASGPLTFAGIAQEMDSFAVMPLKSALQKLVRNITRYQLKILDEDI